MQQHDTHPFYRAVLKLYPKAHRQEYGEQMVQTLDDLLSERQGAFERLGIWLRVAFELPHNLAEEHINNIRGMNMNDIKLTNKKFRLAVGLVGIIAVVVVLLLILHRPNQYQPTTLSKVPRSATPPACVQDRDNPNLSVKSEDQTFIANAVTLSIIDVPAGTNVDVHLKSYSESGASGTAIYSGKYGRYNLVASKTSSNTSNDYEGGWKITSFEVCKG